MQHKGGNHDTEQGAEQPRIDRSDGAIARDGETVVADETKPRIRPINVFELARRVYSSRRTSHRPLKLFRSK
jgi:hypothetical protein